MVDRYDFRDIEPKWQCFWQAHKMFRAPGPGEPGFDPKKPKYYVLGMFPYPSGAGLHVGHPLSYTAVDILARYKRMKGFNVLNPVGWDSFGLPAEQYAIKTGFPPNATTLNSINIFRRQLMSLGFSYDWDREVATSSPTYYQWTQWIFLQLWKNGLAYKAEAPVWWCEKLGTVLANEEVDEEGLSEVGHHPCVRLPLSQWFLRITKYARRLAADLDNVNWPENIKEMQRQWIGESIGTDIAFLVDKDPPGKETIWVFTTRPDTVFGATYLVLAPEHPMVDHVTTDSQRDVVAKYKDQTFRRSDRSRISDTEKTGVWTGSWAINPATEKRIPIWMADYVLPSYGTGAVMGVPAHDERDYDFAMALDLPILAVIKPPDPENNAIVRRGTRDSKELICFVGEGAMVNSPPFDGLQTAEAKRMIFEFLCEKDKAREAIRYKLRDWLFSRQRYWGEPIPLLRTADGEFYAVADDDLPVELPEQADFKPSGRPEPPLAKNKGWVNTSLPDGTPCERETNIMPQWAGSCFYYLRFLDPSNESEPWSKEKEHYWMPVDMYIGGAEHAVLHLLYARFWHKFLFDHSYVSTSEPFASLFNQGMIQGLAYKSSAGSYLASDSVRFEGKKALHPETGEELEEVIIKMSKSVGNVVNPDEIIHEYGADTLRLYLMSMGPLEVDKPWNTRAIMGVHRFLHRVWRLIVGDDNNDHVTPCRSHLLKEEGQVDPELERALQKTIAKVESDIERLAFNTAVAQMMTFVNNAYKKSPTTLTRSQASRFLMILSPFAPHIAEELWVRLGRTDFLALTPWPEVDAAAVRDEVLELPVQVNGKHRATISVSAEAGEEEIIAHAKSDPVVMRHCKGKTIVKEIYVSRRIVNLIVKEDG